MERRGFLKVVGGVLSFFGLIDRKAEARAVISEGMKPGPTIHCQECGWAGEASLLNPTIGAEDEVGGRALDWHFSAVPKCPKCKHEQRNS